MKAGSPVGLAASASGFPGASAVVGLEHRLLISHREAVLLVQKPHTQDQAAGGNRAELWDWAWADRTICASSGRLRWWTRWPVSVTIQPEFSFRKKMDRGSSFSGSMSPVRAAVAGEQRGGLYLPVGGHISNPSHGDAALGGGKRQIDDLQLRWPIVKILDAQRSAKARARGSNKRTAEASMLTYALTRLSISARTRRHHQFQRAGRIELGEIVERQCDQRAHLLPYGVEQFHFTAAVKMGRPMLHVDDAGHPCARSAAPTGTLHRCLPADR